VKIWAVIVSIFIWQSSLAQQDSSARSTKSNKSKFASNYNDIDSLKNKKLDSLKSLDPISRAKSKVDSLNNLAQSKMSFINKKIDSLSRLNPINQLNAKADSLKQTVEGKLAAIDKKIDDIQNYPQRQLASLQQLATEKVNQLKTGVENKIETSTSKVTNLQNNLTTGVNELPGTEKLDLGMNLNDKLPDVNKTLENLSPDLKDLTKNLPSIKTDIPELDINLLNSETKLPGTKMEGDLNVPGVKTSDLNTGKEIKTTGKLNLQELNVPGNDQLSNITEKLGEVKAIQTEAGQYVKGAKEIQQNGIRNVDTKELEKRAFELSGMEEVDTKMQEFNRLAMEKEQMLQKYRDKKLLEAELKRKMTNVANEKINAFTPAVKQAQTELLKVKKLSPMAASLKEAVEKRPNEMKGKPLRERLVPGLAFQVFRGDVFSLDLAPQIGYRFSGRLTAGVGGQYRVSINKKFEYYVQGAGVYGGRAYMDFKAFRSIYLHAEFEALQLEDRAIPTGIEDSKPLVYSSHFGLGKQFNMSKRVSAMMLAFYRLEYDGHLPGATKYNARLVLNLRPKKKKTTESK
jgi:hypothetical protein